MIRKKIRKTLTFILVVKKGYFFTNFAHNFLISGLAVESPDSFWEKTKELLF